MLLILTMVVLSILSKTHPHLWKVGTSLSFFYTTYLLVSQAYYIYDSKAVVIMLVASVRTAIIIAYLTHHYKVHNFRLKFPYLLLFLRVVLLIFLRQDFSTYCSLYDEWYWKSLSQFRYQMLFETYLILTSLFTFLILWWTSKPSSK